MVLTVWPARLLKPRGFFVYKTQPTRKQLASQWLSCLSGHVFPPIPSRSLPLLDFRSPQEHRHAVDASGRRWTR